LGGYSLDSPQKGLRKPSGHKVNRLAKRSQLEVKSATVTLTNNKAGESINIVLAQEINANKEEEPIRWLLITTEPVDTLTQALKVMRIYTALALKIFIRRG